MGDEGSFSALVKRFGGDVPAGAMRTELKRVGSVSESDCGTISVKKRSFWPADMTQKLETTLVHHVYPLVCNVEYNTNPENEGNGRAQYAAYSLNIRIEDRPRLKRMCSDRLAEMAASFDDLFIAYESRDASVSKKGSKPVMVGMYYFEENDQRAIYEW